MSLRRGVASACWGKRLVAREGSNKAKQSEEKKKVELRSSAKIGPHTQSVAGAGSPARLARSRGGEALARVCCMAKEEERGADFQVLGWRAAADLFVSCYPSWTSRSDPRLSSFFYIKITPEPLCRFPTEPVIDISLISTFGQTDKSSPGTSGSNPCRPSNHPGPYLSDLS